MKSALAALVLLAGTATAFAQSVPADAVKDLAPTGKLRAAINLSNIVLAQRDAAGPKGVTPDLARELAKRLNVPVELVPFDAAGKVFEAAKTEKFTYGMPGQGTTPHLSAEKIFKVLAKLKGLRGTAFDVFGKTEERRTERALIGEYRALVDELVKGLSAKKLAQAVELARLPEDIRGFGHVKEANLAAARIRWNKLLAQWRDPAAAQRAA